MILKKIYTEPKQLFEPVKFIDGINFIFGKKEQSTDTKKSLNGIGKSTFLDLLDFALLSSYRSDTSPRLMAAQQKGILKGLSVVLEFEVNQIEYAISRSFEEPNSVKFSINDSSFEDYSVDDLKRKLCKIIFLKKDYEGYFDEKWLRYLLLFFLKIQKPKKEKFTDPVKYIKELTAAELNQYLLFLMDIDNKLAHQNFKLQTDLKNIEPTIKGIKKFILESYGIQDIGEASSRVKTLIIEIEEIEKAIKSFNLSKQYQIDESRANKLTAEIKELWFLNHQDRKKIDAYRDSVHEEINVNPLKIKRMYEELNSLLANNIKKSLDEAIKFKKKLISSRQEFIEEEINQLVESIRERELEIEKKGIERRSFFAMLESEKAITDLTEAFKSLSNKQNEKASLESQTKIYQDLIREKNQIEQEEKKLEGKILDYSLKNEKEELAFSRLFRSIYNYLYPDLNDPSIFSISPNLDADSKLQINILPNNEMLSKGRNQGRTLIYDLAVLLNSIDKKINAPRFLVHDGIFDGMDKAHFIKLYEFLEEQKLQGKRFQYILTYNEEGTLTDNFGNADKVTTEKIEAEAILVLSPKKKLLGDF
ncbi:hypothetical protein GCM10011514_03210 [Emticicia aquatilis]|uniref:DUF2326 domain-containing protein n=1 Tax=Emticicia aquatilis TaxID=1537369 RepID=A0A916YFK0_9BACT|nr:DUF2326 domain-containing protein [Emticicia aquatilis]GGD42600.1 hypothetical protein GCM10011514_03210 [Emticicia aquatilis]